MIQITNFRKTLVSSLCFLSFAASFSACTRQADSESTEVRASEQTLIFGRPGDSVGFDPARNDEGESLNILTNIFENLVGFKLGTTELEPRLATSWTVSDDGKVYRFQLRPEVKFHDGTEFNADAVVFAIERQWKRDHPAYEFMAPYSYWETMAMGDIIESVKALSPLEVEIRLKRPNTPFLANMAMPFMAIPSPTAVMKWKDRFDQNPAGTGPYTLESWRRNEALLLKAFPEYWGEAPHIERVIVRVIPDNQVRVMELKRGGIHIMDYPNLTDVAQLEADPEVQVLKQEGLNVGYISFNMRKKPLDDVRVRKALSMAIDRDRIIKEVFEGYGVKAKNPMPPMIMGYARDVEETELNLEKARALLKEAGVENLKLNLYAMPVARPYMPDAREVAQYVQADLKKIGVDIEIVSFDWGTYLDKIGKGEHDMCIIGWTGDNGDPDNFLFTLWSKDSAQQTPTNNYSFYEDEQVTEWLKRAQIESNPEQRAELYRRAQRKMAEDRPFLPLAHSQVIVPARAEIEGYAVNPMGDRLFANVRFRAPLKGE